MALSGLSASQKEDMIVSLATLVLHDSGKDVTADNLNALVKASGNTVQAFWGSLYAKFVEGRDLDDLIMKPGMGGGPAVGAAAGGAAAEAAVEQEEEEEEEEESAGGAGGLFGDDEEDDW